MNKVQLLLAASILALPGCGSMSFAPPEVSLTRHSVERSVDRSCTLPANSGEVIEQNLDGALQLVGNFIDAYRCTMRVAADGRQAFQLPGFIALAGSAAATALGGGPRWTIAGGAASAIFGAGNSYYDNVAQTRVLSDALEALDCIQSESVGIEAFARLPRTQNAAKVAERNAAQAEANAAQHRVNDARQTADQAEHAATEANNDLSGERARFSALTTSRAAQSPPADAEIASQNQVRELEGAARNANAAFRDASDELRNANLALAGRLRDLNAATTAAAALDDVTIGAERQYFHMISAALLDVEVAAAQRLASRGTPFDGAAVAARIAELATQANKDHENANSPPDQTREAALAAATQVTLHLTELRTRLQICITRAQA